MIIIETVENCYAENKVSVRQGGCVVTINQDRRYAHRQPLSFSLIAKKTKQKKLFLFLSRIFLRYFDDRYRKDRASLLRLSHT